MREYMDDGDKDNYESLLDIEADRFFPAEDADVEPQDKWKLRAIYQLFDSRKEATRNFIGSILAFGTDREGNKAWHLADPEWEITTHSSLGDVYATLAKKHDVAIYSGYKTVGRRWELEGKDAIIILNHLVSGDDARSR